MRSCAVAIIVVLVWNVSANSLTPSSHASSRIIGNMKKELDSLQILIRKIAARKCDAVDANYCMGLAACLMRRACLITGRGFSCFHSRASSNYKYYQHMLFEQPTGDPYGAVYTRWGHHNCPGTQTRLVYSGYVGGAHYSQKGGAADYLCLTRHPKLSTDRRKYSHFGYLYGSEYEFGNHNSKRDHDVPCAVCQSKVRRNSLMLPGSNVCPTGWHREYKGLIMSGDSVHPAASQHVCVDNAQKTVRGGHANKNGKLFHPVKTQCGSLKCPPYKNNQLVTCAVCTR